MTPDWLLLRRYAKDNSQEAFALLTDRYLNLVYTVCLREVHDPELAQDVTQAVFVLLARTAPSFRSKTALPGWLFRTARFASQNARTREQRRRYYEEKAAMERHPQARTDEAEWSEIEPVLNKALAALKAADRDSILLRFFQGMSFAEVGASLGLSEDAACKRVARALEKLRHFFTKEEVYLPSATLAGLLTAHAAQTAPEACQAAAAHLAASTLAGHASAALAGSHAYQLTEGVLKAMKIAKLKMLTSSIAIVVVGGAVSYGMLHGQAPDQKTAYRTVILTGKVRYADGTPVGSAWVGAQLMNSSAGPLLQRESEGGNVSERYRQDIFNQTQTRADGIYKLAVGADLAYDVMVFPGAESENTPDDNGWVAPAVQNVSGHKKQEIHVPDLVLTPGTFVTGIIIDKNSGKPVSGVPVYSQGPEHPDTSMAQTTSATDQTGHYRLRVAPGTSQVRIASQRYTGGNMTFDDEVASGLAKTVSVTAGQPVTINFQVTPK